MLHPNGLIHDIKLTADARGCALDEKIAASAMEAVKDEHACAAFFGGDLGLLLRMPFSDRTRITAQVIGICEAAGKALIVECGALSAEQTQTLLRLAAEEGADAVSLMAPMFFGVTARELETFCKTMLPLIPAHMDAFFRNDQRFSSNRLSAALCSACAAQFPQLKGLIDDTVSAEKLEALTRAYSGCCIAASGAVWSAASKLGFRAFIG